MNKEKEKDNIIDDFISYCQEDNQKLADNIKIWLADFFDIPNRTQGLSKYEKRFINLHISEELQKELFSEVIA